MILITFPTRYIKMKSLDIIISWDFIYIQTREDGNKGMQWFDLKMKTSEDERNVF